MAESLEIGAVLNLLKSPASSQQEKAQLLVQLDRFQKASDVWRLCCVRLSGATQATSVEALQYHMDVYLFLINCLEKLVSSPTRWGVTPNEGKNQIRETLLAISRHSPEVILRRKACQVLALVGKRDCVTIWFGFAEFVREEADQRRYGLLAASCELFGASTSTSSSTDTSGFQMSKFRLAELRQYEAELLSPNLVAALTVHMSSSEETIKATLAFVEWVTLEQLTFDFITVLLAATEHPVFGSIALNTVAQLLDRNYYPPNAEQFIESVALKVFDIASKTPPERLDQDSTLVHAILQLITSFTKRHLTRAEKYFSIPQFLEIFYRFTFQLKDLRLFLMSLEVWEIFIEKCQEFEVATNSPSPYGAPVLGVLLWNLLERFLFIKSPFPSVLEGLEQSDDMVEQEGDDMDGDEGANDNHPKKNRFGRPTDEDDYQKRDAMSFQREDSDLSYLVAKVVKLVQRTAMLPVSSLASLSNLLDSVYKSLSSELLGKLTLPTVPEGRRAARDISVFLRVLAACSAIFVSEHCMNMREIAQLAGISLEVARLCLTQQLWIHGPSFAQLFSQALTCATGMCPWAVATMSVQFSNGCASLVLDTLQIRDSRLPSVCRLKAVVMLTNLHSSRWVDQLLRPTLYDFCAAFDPEKDKYIRHRLYLAFALAASNAPETFKTGLSKDVHLLANSEDLGSDIKLALDDLAAVISATSTKPESTFKKLVYSAAGAFALARAIELLTIQHLTLPVLNLLGVSFANLRRQIGDGECALIVRRCLESTGAMNTKALSKVLGLLYSVVEENTNAFDSLLPSIFSLVFQFSADPNDFDEIMVRIIYQSLHGHWRWFELTLQTVPLHHQLFIQLCESLVRRIDMRYPPDVVRLVAQTLVDLGERHHLLSNPLFGSVELPLHICLRAIHMLASKERELIADDLNTMLFATGSVIPDHFLGLIMPEVAKSFTTSARPSVPSIKMFDAAALKDPGLFEVALFTFCASVSN